MTKIFYTYKELQEMFYENHLDDAEFVIDKEMWVEVNIDDKTYYISIDEYRGIHD